MRTVLTATAAIAAAVAAVYAVPATTTAPVAAVRPVEPAAVAPDTTLLDAEPIYHVVTNLHQMMESEILLLPSDYERMEHDHSTHTHATTPKRTSPRVLSYGRWRTPEAAMRHLVRAYNAQDAEALKDVTTPAARMMLDPMRPWAPDLRLVRCDARDGGGFDCTFTHAYENKPGRGEAVLQVMSARKQGWYATQVIECG